MLSDADLVRSAQSGDSVSLGLLLERYRAPLYGSALRVLGHGPQAQDAVQDTFLVALRKIDHVREPAAVGGWLHTVLCNVCLMRLREGQREVLFDELPRRAESTASETSVEESIDRLELSEWVWTALGRLPEALQVTAVLRYFSGHASYEEISATLGVPVGTVKSRLSAAKIKLAEALLETAGTEHSETRRLGESRTRFFRNAYDEHNRRASYDTLAGAFSEDLVLSISGETPFTGDYGFMIGDIEGDLEAGRKVYPTDVISSKGVSVIECEVANPPDDPFHCPPAFSQVAVYRDDRIHRMYWCLPPPPNGEGSWRVASAVTEMWEIEQAVVTNQMDKIPVRDASVPDTSS